MQRRLVSYSNWNPESIIFHHYKELKKCILEIEQIEGTSRATDRSSNKKLDLLTTRKEEQDTRDKERKIELPAGLDGYFIHTT